MFRICGVGHDLWWMLCGTQEPTQIPLGLQSGMVQMSGGNGRLCRHQLWTWHRTRTRKNHKTSWELHIIAIVGTWLMKIVCQSYLKAGQSQASSCTLEFLSRVDVYHIMQVVCPLNFLWVCFQIKYFCWKIYFFRLFLHVLGVFFGSQPGTRTVILPPWTLYFQPGGRWALETPKGQSIRLGHEKHKL